MQKRKLVEKGKGYKVYLRENGELITVFESRFNPSSLRGKVVDKSKKKKTRAQIKREVKKEIDDV